MAHTSWPALDPTEKPAQQLATLDKQLRELRAALDDTHTTVLRIEADHSTKTVHLRPDQYDLLVWAIDAQRGMRMLRTFGKAALTFLAVGIIALSGWDKLVEAATAVRGVFFK